MKAKLCIPLCLMLASGGVAAAPPLAKAGPTIVLLVRHADRKGADDELSPAGEQRAVELMRVLEKTALADILITPTQRSKKTVQPTALAKGITPLVYPYSTPPSGADLDRLLERVRLRAGGTLLVAAHSDTLPLIVARLGADPQVCKLSGPTEFDTLCMVVVLGPGQARAVNLQYGAPSP